MLQLIYKWINPVLLLFALQANIYCDDDSSLVNTSHLDFLFEEIKIGGKEIGIIHIYSNYPEYQWTGDDDEGIACVDDAARASVFYLKHYLHSSDGESIRKNHLLINFLLHMQDENGFFFNFIWPDHSINKTFRTSVAQPDWWSWRALWALTEAYNFYKVYDPSFAQEIFSSVVKLVSAVKKIIPEKYDTAEILNFKRPSWLPFGTASDQAAILLLGLSSYCRETSDKEILQYCGKLSEGMIMMQEGDTAEFPYGAFLSWENLWHGWGNTQSFSLLKFYEITKEEYVKSAALKEINFFYSYLIKENYLNEFKIKKKNGGTSAADLKEFPQIAYMIRPMVYSCLLAYEITDDTSYAVKGADAASWFFGNNRAEEQIYFPKNGKCFDGITGPETLNKNSGAESTIEALLTMIEFDKDPYLKNLIKKNQKILTGAD